MEVSNAGHHPTDSSACAVAAGIRFVETLTADPRACANDGTPPAVLPRAPLWAAGLPPVPHKGNARERRAVAVLVATVGSLLEQLPVLQAWGTVDALRGGRFSVGEGGELRLADVQLVRDARVSGALTGDGAGDWHVSGPGVASGTVHVVLGERITGTVGRSRVDVELGNE